MSRYETGRPEEALASLKESMQLWFKRQACNSDEDDDDAVDDEDLDLEAMAEELGMAAGTGKQLGADCKDQPPHAAGPTKTEDEEEEEPFVPSYEFRIETAKLLVELDDSSETAIQVRCSSRDVRRVYSLSTVHRPGTVHSPGTYGNLLLRLAGQ